MNLTVDALGIGDNVDQQRFDSIDYVVFSLMLLLSALTGLYYGCFHSRTTSSTEPQDSNAKFNDYLTGDKKMTFFPVSMSLVASYVSGVTILGTPAEVYDYGTQYCLIIVSIWIMGIVVGTVYMPVFRQNELKSSYEYLEKRFDKSIRLFASIMFLIDEILFLPMVIYVPSLAFNQVTGINLHVIGTIVTAVCIFYTVLGGIRAVVWTDTWQIITMFISVLIVTVLGTIEVGGFNEVIRKNLEKNRIQFFNLSTSLYERQSVLSVLIGGTFYWTAYNSVNQTMVQRYLSLPTLKESRKSLIMFTIGVSLFVGVCCFSGLLIFATYDNCDPLTDGKINANDQLLPLFVMQTVGHLKGIPGLFVAGVFGAALSSLSVILNSTSIVILEDLMKSSLKIRLSTRNAQIFVRFAVMFLGVMAISFLYIVEHLGGVLSTAASLSAIAASTSFGLFSLGMLFPQANSKGALFGGIAGALTSGWISLGTQYATITHKLIAEKLPVSTDGCLRTDLSTIATTTVTALNTSLTSITFSELQKQNENASSIFPLYRLSFHWITPIGSLTVIGVGLAVSFLTGGTDYTTLNPLHLSPVLKHFMSSKNYRRIGQKHHNEVTMTDFS